MELLIPLTDSTPHVLFNDKEGKFTLRGVSMPEDAIKFYTPIFNWLEEYKHSPKENNCVNIEMEYFNTISAKKILDILLIFSEINEQNSVSITWKCEEEDTDMINAVSEYEEIIEMPIEVELYA